MTKPSLVILALGLSFAVGACTPPEDEYPISGEECTAEDAVLDIDSSDLNCVPPA